VPGANQRPQDLQFTQRQSTTAGFTVYSAGDVVGWAGRFCLQQKIIFCLESAMPWAHCRVASFYVAAIVIYDCNLLL
jgi:hypothetical protein